MTARFANVDDYIGSFPPDVQVILEGFRQAIRSVAPGSEEIISYQIPTVTLNGKHLVYFAGWKHHVGLYPVPTLDPALENEISQYRSGKDTLRFPLQDPVPYPAIERVVTSLMQRRQGRSS